MKSFVEFKFWVVIFVGVLFGINVIFYIIIGLNILKIEDIKNKVLLKYLFIFVFIF